ncbi:hypothetical protein Tco_0544891 [Tanacetum coccineum]
MADDGPFQPKTAEGANKPEAQWPSDEGRVVNQDQRLKSIIISCLPGDIIEYVISCEIAKDTWTDLVHSFEGPSDTKENMIMDLKLEYNTFRPKPSEGLLQTYTWYKTLLNELSNDGVKLSKHKINVGFVNSLPEKCVMSSVKLLPEIKGLLLMKPNRERYLSLTFDLIAPQLYSILGILVRPVGVLVVNRENFKERRNEVTMFEKSDYGRLFGPLSNPNVALFSSPEEMRHAWFMASVEFIKGLADQDSSLLQDDEARGNCIEHHNGLCDDTEDGNFVEGLDETICQKSNRMSVEEGDGVLDSEGDGVHLSQTNDVIQQAGNLSTMSSTSLQARNAALESSQTFVMFKSLLKTNVCTENESTDLNPKGYEEIPNFCSDHNDTSNHIAGVSTEANPSSTSSHPGNDEDASHLDDLMEIDGENAKDDYTNSQHHLHLLIKALSFKTKFLTIDVVVPPKDDDRFLRTVRITKSIGHFYYIVR